MVFGEFVVWWLVCKVNRRLIEVCFGPDVISCGWLGSRYQLTNCLQPFYTCWHFFFFFTWNKHQPRVESTLWWSSLPLPHHSSCWSHYFHLFLMSPKQMNCTVHQTQIQKRFKLNTSLLIWDTTMCNLFTNNSVAKMDFAEYVDKLFMKHSDQSGTNWCRCLIQPEQMSHSLLLAVANLHTCLKKNML